MNDPNPDPASRRDLPAKGWPRFFALFRRAAGKRCPQCGAKGIFKNYLELRERCPQCQYKFEREEGYFLGGYALNVVVVGLLPLLLLIYFLAYTDYSWVTLEFIFIPMVIILPLLFFPYTRTIWMVIDLMADPTEHTEKRLRHDQMT